VRFNICRTTSGDGISCTIVCSIDQFRVFVSLFWPWVFGLSSLFAL
jgi:hypothetical protein